MNKDVKSVLWSVAGIGIPLWIALTWSTYWVIIICIMAANVIGYIEGRNKGRNT